MSVDSMFGAIVSKLIQYVYMHKYSMGSEIYIFCIQ